MSKNRILAGLRREFYEALTGAHPLVGEAARDLAGECEGVLDERDSAKLEALCRIADRVAEECASAETRHLLDEALNRGNGVYRP